MISTPISNGFGGLTSSLLESLRDEFSKSKIFTTAMMENSDSWKRADTEVCYVKPPIDVDPNTTGWCRDR